MGEDEFCRGHERLPGRNASGPLTCSSGERARKQLESLEGTEQKETKNRLGGGHGEHWYLVAGRANEEGRLEVGEPRGAVLRKSSSVTSVPEENRTVQK